MPRRSSIFMKILVVILPLVSVPIVIVGYFSVQASADRVNRLVRQEQQLLLEAAAERINRLLEQTRIDLNTLAGLPVLEDLYLARSFRLSVEEEFHRESILRIFTDFLSRTPVYSRLTCLDEQGRLLVTLEREKNAGDSTANDAEVFDRAVAVGENGFYISNLIRKKDDPGFILYGAKAYYSGMNQLTGVVIIDLNFNFIEQLVESIRVGDQGYAFLLDQNGRNIVHPTFEPYRIGPDRLPDPSLEPLFDAMTAGNSGWQSYYFEGVDKEAVYAPIPALKWSLAVTVPIMALHKEALAVRSRVIQVVALVVLLTLTVVSILSYNLLRPVRRLVGATHRLAEGDLSFEIPVQSHDELGDLTVSFNQMVRNLARTRDELVRSAKLISLGRLSAGVAHEIRNPLNAMKAAMVHLKRRRADDPLIKEYSELISEEIDRLNRFVTDFLIFAKQSPLQRTLTDLNMVINSVARLFREKANQSNVTFFLRLDPDLPSILVDARQIEQVLVNLAINAMEAMPEGGSITITSTWLPAGSQSGTKSDRIRITIRDTGPGIPIEHLESIYDPFFTTKENGTGLGLPLSLGIIESHGGRLTVENHIGQGATAYLDLPVSVQDFREPIE